jgi:GNAT superfamily N-acetyltransferase
MQQYPVIRSGQASDTEVLVKTLSDSFSEDPVMNWVIPSNSIYPDYFQLVINEVYLPRGIVHLEDSGQATALWLPPQERMQMAPRLSLLKLALRIVLKGGVRALGRIQNQGRIFQKHHPLEPHYYLQFIGCQQNAQRRGMGSALLKHGTRMCDDQGMPAYLESSNAQNVPLYQRHGFEVIAREQLGRDGPVVCFMWRDAR